MNWWEDQRTLKLKYFLEKMTLCDVWKLFSYKFLWRWRSKDSFVLKFERCEHRNGHFYCRWRSRRCEVLTVFCAERPKWSPSNQDGLTSLLDLSTQRQLTLHTFLISIYNRSVISMFTPFKLQDNWIFRSPPSKKHIGKQFSHITKCHLLQKVFKLQVLWSSHQFIKQGWRRN